MGKSNEDTTNDTEIKETDVKPVIDEDAVAATKEVIDKMLEDARKEAEKILKAAKKTATSSTETVAEDSVPDEVKKTLEYMREKVTINLFKDPGEYKDDVFVAVNGERFLIKRGVDVEVPRYVAEVLKQSREQDQKTADLIEEKSSEYAKSLE